MACQDHFGSQRQLSRRNFFERFSDGIGGVALATLLSRDLCGATVDSPSGLPDGHRRIYDLKPRPTHFPPKAKAVIHLFMNGGPSQMDLFDPKPKLDKHNGEANFDTVAADLITPAGRRADAQPVQIHTVRQVRHVDFGVDATSCRTGGQDLRNPLHVHGAPQSRTGAVRDSFGASIPGRPSMGSWVVFGLGSENQNLPAYVVLDDPLGLPIKEPKTGRRFLAAPIPGNALAVRWFAYFGLAARISTNPPNSSTPSAT